MALGDTTELVESVQPTKVVTNSLAGKSKAAA